MKQIATRLGLSAEASEEAILGELTKLENRATAAEGQLAPLKTEVTTLRNRVQALDAEQIDADLAAHGIKEESVLNRVKPVLATMKNRADRVEFIKLFGSPATATETKPLTNRSSDWSVFGTVEKANVKVEETREEIMAPSPGAYRRVDQMRTAQMTGLIVVVQEVQELVLQSLLRSGPITDGLLFVPGSKPGELRGWFNLTNYSQRDNPALNWQFYAVASVRELELENRTLKPQVEFALLFNALESGKSNLA